MTRGTIWFRHDFLLSHLRVTTGQWTLWVSQVTAVKNMKPTPTFLSPKHTHRLQNRPNDDRHRHRSEQGLVAHGHYFRLLPPIDNAKVSELCWQTADHLLSLAGFWTRLDLLKIRSFSSQFSHIFVQIQAGQSCYVSDIILCSLRDQRIQQIPYKSPTTRSTFLWNNRNPETWRSQAQLGHKLTSGLTQYDFLDSSTGER